MKFISIIIGKMLILVGKLLHRGSSLPGEFALKINKKLFKTFKLPKTVIAVTGSSGKGSISGMLAKIYRDNGYTVAHNYKGSNLSAGIATLLLENCKLNGKIKKDVLIYEIDERYAKYVFKDITPHYVVISNICRDQPPRQGHFDLVYEEIKKALKPGMHLILNGDDPYLQKFVLEDKYNVTYYGIEKNKYSYKVSPFSNLNLIYCPKCNQKLEYEFYQFENIGHYTCPNCSFGRPQIDYKATHIDYSKSEITINDRYVIHIPFNVLYCAYNTLAAFTVSAITNLDMEKVVKTISSIEGNKKIYDSYYYNDRKVTVLSNKNENSTTFNQSLLYTKRFKELKTVVIGWKEISRRYKFDDLSWLYDIDFEILNTCNVEKVLCVGIHAFDIATRLKYAGIDEKNILVFDSLNEIKDTLTKKTKGDIYAILNFDYVNPFNELLEGEIHEH